MTAVKILCKGFWGNTKDPTVESTYSKPFELMDDIQKR